MAPPSPPSAIEQLAYVILLSSIKKQASEVRIRLAIQGYVLVELLIDGVALAPRRSLRRPRERRAPTT